MHFLTWKGNGKKETKRERETERQRERKREGREGERGQSPFTLNADYSRFAGFPGMN